MTGRFLVESDGSYTIKFQNTGGQMNPDPVVYDIHAIKDLVPTVKFVSPEPRIKAPSNGKVALKIEAGDDYGVKSLNLNVNQGTEGLVSRDLLENKAPPRKFAGTEILDLAAIPGLKPGTNLEYWLVVRDTKEPSSNSAKDREADHRDHRAPQADRTPPSRTSRSRRTTPSRPPPRSRIIRPRKRAPSRPGTIRSRRMARTSTTMDRAASPSRPRWRKTTPNVRPSNRRISPRSRRPPKRRSGSTTSRSG